jgi:hypothetical protein
MKIEKKEGSIQRLKKDLEASRTFNGKLQHKVRYLQTKIVEGYRDTKDDRSGTGLHTVL